MCLSGFILVLPFGFYFQVRRWLIHTNEHRLLYLHLMLSNRAGCNFNCPRAGAGWGVVGRSGILIPIFTKIGEVLALSGSTHNSLSSDTLGGIEIVRGAEATVTFLILCPLVSSNPSEDFLPLFILMVFWTGVQRGTH